MVSPQDTLLTNPKIPLDDNPTVHSLSHVASSSSKWVSPRYAIIRDAMKTDAIIFIKRPTTDNSTTDNSTDITTKPFPGATFLKHRAAILGHTPFPT